MFRYVDLFSGCGGLSLGLSSAGGAHVLAVEKSDMAAHTYFANFIDRNVTPDEWSERCARPVAEQLLSGLAVSTLREVLDSSSVELQDLNVDVVVGGPPCQGFSLAGRRNPDDARNQLPWEFLEFVERTRPKAVVIENVVGMSHKFSGSADSPFIQLQTALAETGPGYVVQGVAVNAKHYGAPQHRPRLMIIGLQKSIANEMGVRSTGSTWTSNYIDQLDVDQIPALAPVPTLRAEQERTVRDAIGDLVFANALPQSHQAREFLDDLNRLSRISKPAEGDSQAPLNHIRRRHSEPVTSRFQVYQWLAMRGLSHRIVSAVSYASVEDSEKATALIRSQTYPAVSPGNVILAEDADAMIDLIKSLATRKHSQKALSWSEPAKTVVTLPDDYVHPEDPRILTVRELARLQGFPDTFEFKGRETTGAHRRKFEVPQYSQVGNAVSPFLGRAVGELIDRLMARAAMTAPEVVSDHGDLVPQ